MLARLAVIALLVAGPEPAHANVIWPAAILAERQLAWWLIGVSLAIEWYFVWRTFRLNARDAAWATLAANGVSAGIGIFFVPFLGILVAAGLYAAKIDWYDFSPLDWAVSYLTATAFATAIELAVFRFGFRYTVDRRAAGLILLANAITVGLALVSLSIVSAEPY